jgi:hypothetical protein
MPKYEPDHDEKHYEEGAMKPEERDVSQVQSGLVFVFFRLLTF